MTVHAPVEADPIGLLMPWTGKEERWLRNRLLIAQQRASCRALAAKSPAARSLFWLIVDTAAGQVTTPASCECLRELREGLLRLFCVADMFERREGGHVE